MPIKQMILRLCILYMIVVSTIVSSNPIDVEKLFSRPTYEALTIAPDGKHVLLLRKPTGASTNSSKLRLVDISNNKVVSRMSLPNGYILQNQWLDEKLLYVGMTFKRNRTDLAATDLQLLINIEDNNINITRIPVSGYLLTQYDDKYLYAKRRSTSGGYSEYFDLYKATLDEIKKDEFSLRAKVDHKENRLTHYIYSESIEQILGIRYNESTERTHVKKLDVRWAEWQPLFSLKESKYVFQVIDLLDDQTLAVLTNRNTDKIVLQKYSLKDRKLGEIIYQHPHYDLIDAGFKRDAQAGYVKYIERGLIQVHYFEQSTMALLSRFKETFGDDGIYPIDKTKNGDLLLFITGADNPGTYYVYQNDSAELKKIADKYVQLNKLTFSNSKVIKTETSDGYSIESYLNEPTSYSHNTLLVMPHGGPIGIRDFSHFDPRTQYFTSRGFATLKVNFRGSSGFGEDFQKQGIGEFGKLIEKDINAVLEDVLADKSFSRICTMGSSYGGYSAVILALNNPERFDCIVSTYGIYDLKLLFNASNIKASEEYREAVAEVVGEYNDQLAETSPTNYVDDIRQPILLIAGKRDDIADFEHTNRFLYLLNEYDKEVETMFYDNVGHGHSSIKGIQHELAVKHDYLIRTLKLDDTFASLSEEGKEAIGSDYSLLSANEMTISGYSEEIDYHYNKMAAQFGDYTALYNIGVAHDTDGSKPLDREMAFDNYVKAADSGSVEAMKKVAEMYMGDDFVDADWALSKKYYAMAMSAERTPENIINYAKVHCLAPKPVKNISRCLGHMTFNQFSGFNRAKQRTAVRLIEQTIASIYGAVDLTANDVSIFRAYLQGAFELPFRAFSVDTIKPGLYQRIEPEGFGDIAEYEIKAKGFEHTSPNTKLKLGVEFSLELEESSFMSDEEVGVIIRWYQMENNTKKTLSENFLYNDSEEDWSSFIDVEDSIGKETYFEIYNINNEKLAEYKFTVGE